MTAARRAQPQPIPAPEGLRAKALRPFERSRRYEVSAQTTEAASSYERAARAYESRRATHPDSTQSEMLSLRTEAARLLELLRKEPALPPMLTADLTRWVEGEFAGSHVDVELANHAIAELLSSDVCAEIPVTSP